MEYTIHSFLEHMKTYSKDTKGVTRLAFTKESQEGWAYICQVMEELVLFDGIQCENVGIIGMLTVYLV